MLTEILQYLRNWFISERVFGEFIVSDGKIYQKGSSTPIQIYDDQHFRLKGSRRNGGIYQTTGELQDEEFAGAIWLMNIDPAIISIAEEIEEWQSKYSAAVVSPYQSESYSRGAYSRTKASAGAKAVTWQTVFADRLAPWRKL